MIVGKANLGSQKGKEGMRIRIREGNAWKFSKDFQLHRGKMSIRKPGRRSFFNVGILFGEGT